MNTTSKITSAIALSFAALSAGNALALEAGDRGIGFAEQFAGASQTTRAAVRAEYQRAAAAGEVVASGDRAERLVAPVATASVKTRDQVRAEYFEAVRSGDIVQSGDIGFKLNQINPAKYSGVNQGGAQRG